MCNQHPLAFGRHLGYAAMVKNAVKVRRTLMSIARRAGKNSKVRRTLMYSNFFACLLFSDAVRAFHLCRSRSPDLDLFAMGSSQTPDVGYLNRLGAMQKNLTNAFMRGII